MESAPTGPWRIDEIMDQLLTRLPPSIRKALKPLDLRPDPYRGPIAPTIQRLAEAVARRQITADQLLDELQSTFDRTDMAAEFARFTASWPAGDNVERWLGPRRQSGRWQDLSVGLQLFFLKPHRSEPPHYHVGIASLQCVVSGRIVCRRFDRVARARDDERVLMIRPVAERELSVGQTFRMTDHVDNVHWFGTGDERAVVLDFYIAGKTLYETPFEPDITRPPSRYYLDPTGRPDADGLIAAPELSSEEAYARFADKDLLTFAWHGRD